MKSALPLIGKFTSSIGIVDYVKDSKKPGLNSDNNPMFTLEENKTIEKLVQDQLATIMPTPTLQPTYTPYPTGTPVPLIENKYTVKGFYSWYWPPLGGINCDKNSDGSEECKFLANGEPFERWIGTGFACPASLPFGTRIKVLELNIQGVCVDRGGQIVIDKYGQYWFDHLIENPLMYWSTPITVEIYPGN